MKTAQAFLLFLVFSFYAKAQKEVIFQDKPLVLVNNFKTDINSFIIRPESIEAIDVFKDSVKVKPYGDEGKNGVILISPKKGIILLTAKDIINKYKIKDGDSNLRFAIDKTIIADESKILIELEEIFTVSVTNDVRWMNVEDSNSKERFINITTIEKKDQ